MGMRPNQLTVSPEPFYGFTSNAVTPMACIRLPLMVGDSDHQSTAMADFLIIGNPSAYNVIMGRPTMNDLNLIISTRAFAIKFPTPNGTECVRGEQYSARHCYEEALKIGLKRKKVDMVSREENTSC